MPPVTRPLTADDLDAAALLGREAFGMPPPGGAGPAPRPADRPGWHEWGTFDGDRLVARAVGREYRSWFGGVQVPTTGVAGVTVRAEDRGRGLLAGLLGEVLAEGGRRGEVVSTLFPTAPGVYRRLGWEIVGSYDAVEVPTATLTGVRGGDGVTLHRAGPADFDAVRAVYDEWAAAQNGPLTRRGPSFPGDGHGFVDSFTGVTVARDDAGRVVGFVSWSRGQGYDLAATIQVADLLATDAGAYRALWRFLGGFASVAGQVRLDTSGVDAARLALPGGGWRQVGSRPYMLRVTDVAGAFSAVPRLGSARVRFAVAGDPLGATDGSYLLTVGPDGTGCTRSTGAGPLPTYTPGGLALAWAGAQSSANLRMAGLLTGPADDDALLDAVLAGRPIHIRDYF